MGILLRFEHRLRDIAQVTSRSLIKRSVEPVEIAGALARETDDRRATAGNRMLVPNDFTVELASTDFAKLAPYAAPLCDELGQMVREHAVEQRYTFVGPVRVRLAEEPALRVGLFRVRSEVATVDPGARYRGRGRRAEIRAKLPRLVVAGPPPPRPRNASTCWTPRPQ
jgi:hypothetical protein